MAAPTDVRVESNSITTTVLYWDYAGSAVLGVYRSTDGVSYSLVTSLVTALRTYEDTGLAVDTKYWYKLSDDGGSTFSSVVTVWTHSCAGGQRPYDTVAPLPGFTSEEDVNATRLEELRTRIEQALRSGDPTAESCVQCSSDGKLVLDCSDGCRNWDILMNEDINSISILNCDEGGTANFHVAPGDTWGLGGWPAGFGASGDEGFRAPLSGGTAGRNYSHRWECDGSHQVVPGLGNSSLGKNFDPKCREDPRKSGSRPGYGGGSSSRWPGGSDCTCTAQLGGLTIKSCNANNSLNCAGSKSLRLIACGGVEPYTWSNTGSVVLSTTTGSSTTVTPPSNAGSAVAGDAYKVCYWVEQRVPNCAAAPTGFPNGMIIYSCADVAGACSNTPSGCGSSPSVSSLKCILALSGCDKPECAGSECGSDRFAATPIDLRTAGMISDGCEPCGLQAGATVSVTDAAGVVTTVVLRN